MTKRLVTAIVTSCDIDHEGEIPATISITVMVDGKPYDLDVCRGHEQISLGDLNTTVTKYGHVHVDGPIRPAKHGKFEGPQWCPVPNCNRSQGMIPPRPFAARGSLRDHARKVHDTTLNVLLGKPRASYVCSWEGCEVTALSPNELRDHKTNAGHR